MMPTRRRQQADAAHGDRDDAPLRPDPAAYRTVEPVGARNGAITDRVLSAVAAADPTSVPAPPGFRDAPGAVGAWPLRGHTTASGDAALRRGGGKGGRKKRGDNDSASEPPPKPDHGQEEIQDFIVGIWLRDPKDETDRLRARYLSDYSRTEGGWCDGWAHALTYGDAAALARLWQRIDELLDPESGAEPLTVTERFDAVQLARVASLYHVTNNPRPTAGAQSAAYDEAGYEPRGAGASGPTEAWRGDFEETPLRIADIIAEVRQLPEGATLRLTSATHDAAVRRMGKSDFIVSETEEFGVRRTDKLDDVRLILANWQETVQEHGDNFFSQKMVVGGR